MQPLYDLNLQQLDDLHVVGNWRVISRRVNPTDGNALADADTLHLDPPPDRALVVNVPYAALTLAAPPGHKAPNATEQSQLGNWSLQRDPLLSRPYLKILLPDGETLALITRMRRSADGADCEMMLYFQTGTEIHLQCT